MEITIEYQPILEAPAASGVKSINYDLFYAKQTQFTGYSNERNLFNNSGLWKYCQLETWWKQTQFKANQTQNKPKTNPIHWMLKWT